MKTKQKKLATSTPIMIEWEGKKVFIHKDSYPFIIQCVRQLGATVKKVKSNAPIEPSSLKEAVACLNSQEFRNVELAYEVLSDITPEPVPVIIPKKAESSKPKIFLTKQQLKESIADVIKRGNVATVKGVFNSLQADNIDVKITSVRYYFNMLKTELNLQKIGFNSYQMPS